VDAYPPLWDVAPGDVTPQSYADADAMEWLPGMQVANPISLGGRSTPVEKAIAYGFSTTTTAATQNAAGRGVRTARGWRVVIVRPLDAADDGEVPVRPGTPTMCAFAVWSGHANHTGSRKAPSRNVYLLYLER
jgi:DMSO reductase family type II enzyme heme b subunit